MELFWFFLYFFVFFYSLSLFSLLWYRRLCEAEATSQNPRQRANPKKGNFCNTFSKKGNPVGYSFFSEKGFFCVIFFKTVFFGEYQKKKKKKRRKGNIRHFPFPLSPLPLPLFFCDYLIEHFGSVGSESSSDRFAEAALSSTTCSNNLGGRKRKRKKGKERGKRKKEEEKEGRGNWKEERGRKRGKRNFLWTFFPFHIRLLKWSFSYSLSFLPLFLLLHCLSEISLNFPPPVPDRLRSCSSRERYRQACWLGSQSWSRDSLLKLEHYQNWNFFSRKFKKLIIMKKRLSINGYHFFFPILATFVKSHFPNLEISSHRVWPFVWSVLPFLVFFISR